jgi:hypothetical protein
MPANEGSLEEAVLREIIFLHPIRLTVEELTLRIAAAPDGPDAVPAKDSIANLKRDGLIRQIDSILEPTHPALRAHELLV